MPLRLQRRAFFLLVGELLFELREAIFRCGVLLLLQRLPFHLALHDGALDLVDLRRHRINFHLQPRRRLVHEVHRLVRQKAVADVAIREHRCGDDRRILNAHAVVHLVAFLEPAQNRDGVLDARLIHLHRLEAPLQRRVLLDILAILVERRRADGAQLAACERGLEHVARIHRALGLACADDGVQFVNEEDDLAIAVRDLFQKCLQSILEFSSELRARDHRGNVHRDQPLVLQRLRHVARDDAAREALDDRRLAHAGLADEHRVVLRAAREHLHRAADFVVATDYRIDLPFARSVREVAPVFLKRLVFVLGILVRHTLRTAHLLECLHELRVRHAEGLHELAARHAAVREREEVMLGAQVFVLQLRHLFLR